MAKKVAQDFRQQWRELTQQIIARAREEVYNLYCKVFWRGIQISCLRKGWAFLQCVVIIMCFMIQGQTQSSPDSVLEGDSLTQALGRVPTTQPCILIKGTLQEIEDCTGDREKYHHCFSSHRCTIGTARGLLCIQHALHCEMQKFLHFH